MANVKKRMKQNVENNNRLHAEEIAQQQAASKKKEKQLNIKFMVKAAIIAAMYTALTLAFYGLSYETMQFRISEILVALIFFEPAAMPGLCLGCFISNMLGPSGIYDVVFGTMGTAVGLYVARWYCSRHGKAPLGLFLYALFNSLMVAYELAIMSSAGETMSVGMIILWVMIGETATAVVGGSILYYILRKRWKDIIGETKKSEAEEFVPSNLL